MTERPTSDIAFTDAVKSAQQRRGSRDLFAQRESQGGWQASITEELASFIAARDSLYLATASADGQPYVQHRGGPKGFLKVLDPQTLAFADFAGNQQYISIGNLSENDKAFMFLMDYVHRRRVKLWGRACFVEDDPALLSHVTDPAYGGTPQRVLRFTVLAWDVNCTSHIAPRHTEDDIATAISRLQAPLQQRIAELESELAVLRAERSAPPGKIDRLSRCTDRQFHYLPSRKATIRSVGHRGKDMAAFDLPRRLAAEGLGTAFLLAGVVGSGIMGEMLAGGNTAIALLGNTVATGAILVVLILIFGPISGAHFNPAVTLSFWMQKSIGTGDAVAYVITQVICGLLGVAAAHFMFDLPLFEWSSNARTGPGQWGGEFVATVGLVATIIGCLRSRPDAVPYAVGLFITAGYWFTSSTSFANPAVTIARCFTDTFSGIRPLDAPAFIAAQIVGAVLVTLLFRWLFARRPD